MTRAAVALAFAVLGLGAGVPAGGEGRTPRPAQELLRAPGEAPRPAPTARQARAHLRRAHQAEAYQTRLRKVRERLGARLHKRPGEDAQAPAGPACPTFEVSVCAPEAPPASPSPPPALAASGLGVPKAPSFAVFRLLLLLVTLANSLGLDQTVWLQPLPALEPTFMPGLEGPGGAMGGLLLHPAGMLPSLDPGPAAAQGGARFNEAILRALGQPPDVPLPGIPAAPGEAPLPGVLAGAFDLAERASPRAGGGPPPSLADLDARLAGFRRWALQAQAAFAGTDAGEASLHQAARDHLAALEGVATGLQAVAAAQRSGSLSATEASALANLASDTILSITNSFRVAIQAGTLTLLPIGLERLQARLDEVQARLEAGGEEPAHGTPRIPVPPIQVPRAFQEAQRACCDLQKLLAQVGSSGSWAPQRQPASPPTPWPPKPPPRAWTATSGGS